MINNELPHAFPSKDSGQARSAWLVNENKGNLMKSYWVYIIKCSDGSYYTGSTSNIEKRMSEHQLGFYKGYTKHKRPVKLMFSQNFTNPNDAVAAEQQIKGWSRVKKEALINSDFDLLVKLSKKKEKSP